jgi:hypothetical protein
LQHPRELSSLPELLTSSPLLREKKRLIFPGKIRFALIYPRVEKRGLFSPLEIKREVPPGKITPPYGPSERPQKSRVFTRRGKNLVLLAMKISVE